jgi:hypothetical protein
MAGATTRTTAEDTVDEHKQEYKEELRIFL